MRDIETSYLSSTIFLLEKMDARETIEKEERISSVKKGAWSSQEDSLLINYIAINGEGRWNFVALHSGTHARPILKIPPSPFRLVAFLEYTYTQVLISLSYVHF